MRESGVEFKDSFCSFCSSFCSLSPKRQIFIMALECTHWWWVVNGGWWSEQAGPLAENSLRTSDPHGLIGSKCLIGVFLHGLNLLLLNLPSVEYYDHKSMVQSQMEKLEAVSCELCSKLEKLTGWNKRVSSLTPYIFKIFLNVFYLPDAHW